MDFLQTFDIQIVSVAVAVFAIVAAAAFFFSSKKPKGCLNPENFKEFKLAQKTQISHNVARFKFELPTPTSVLGLPIGQHISCRGKDGQGEEVIKPYTPTTLDSDVGSFELVIKMYPQGRMSHHFREMRVGDYLAVKGPKGGFVRQELFYLLKDEKDVHFSFGTVQRDGIHKATQGMHSSKFCLNIAGDTPSSNRLFDAIASHCVPVIISDEIELPFEDVLDYSQFCIFVRSSDAIKKKFLINLIRSIGREKWTQMWAKLKEVEHFFQFQYPSKEGDAVQMIWQAVARKVPAIRMKIHKSRRFSHYNVVEDRGPILVKLPNNFAE